MRPLTSNRVFGALLSAYGPQGWWPIYNIKKGCSEYIGAPPATNRDFFEISAGAILTQNTSWKNAEKALAQLKTARLLDPAKIIKTPNADLASLIRSSGYYNQKAIKLKNLSSWMLSRKNSLTKLMKHNPPELRNELLTVKGVGPETADSILLYGLNMKYFVVDAYLKRIFSRLNFFRHDISYHDAQKFVHDKFKGSINDYKEFHALIVNHAVRACKKTPLCGQCAISSLCISAADKALKNE